MFFLFFLTFTTLQYLKQTPGGELKKKNMLEVLNEQSFIEKVGGVCVLLLLIITKVVCFSSKEDALLLKDESEERVVRCSVRYWQISCLCEVTEAEKMFIVLNMG